MKINEFIEKVNRNDRMEAETADGIVTIYDDSEHEVLNIPCDATNLLDIGYLQSYARDSFGEISREYLSALIEELLHTPVKERFPEKKWRLYIGRNEYGNDIYLMNVIGSNKPIRTCMAAKNEYNTFTDSDLVRLKEQYPRLAPAIDAMKEPVEEESNE